MFRNAAGIELLLGGAGLLLEALARGGGLLGVVGAALHRGVIRHDGRRGDGSVGRRRRWGQVDGAQNVVEQTAAVLRGRRQRTCNASESERRRQRLVTRSRPEGRWADRLD